MGFSEAIQAVSAEDRSDFLVLMDELAYEVYRPGHDMEDRDKYKMIETIIRFFEQYRRP